MMPLLSVSMQSIPFNKDERIFPPPPTRFRPCSIWCPSSTEPAGVYIYPEPKILTMGHGGGGDVTGWVSRIATGTSTVDPERSLDLMWIILATTNGIG